MRVLVIDDDPDDRTLAARELKRALNLAEVVEVGTNTALEAELHGSEEPALVVTDYLLGWTDGFDVMLRVRAIYPQCPIIVFTSVVDKTLAARLLNAGANSYIVKSCRKRLGEVAREILEPTTKQPPTGDKRTEQLRAEFDHEQR
jgi:CheY-like chemotaxis protein